MAHKGLREWTGEEVGSLFLGQNGFHVITTGGEIIASGKNATYWIAIKAVDGVVALKAQSYGAGDDLEEGGSYSGSGYIDLADGDIVYGSFDRITVNAGHVLAYVGK